MPGVSGPRGILLFVGRIFPMRTTLMLSAGLLAAALSLANDAFAQLPQARLNAVFPTGGQRGTSVDVTLAGGVDLDEASQLYISHPGSWPFRRRRWSTANRSRSPGSSSSRSPPTCRSACTIFGPAVNTA